MGNKKLARSSLFNLVNGQETKHVKIGHVKIDRAHVRVHFREHWIISREHWKITREHSRGSLRGDPLVRFTQTEPQPLMGISVDIFMYTPVCIFVSTFVREFVGQISRFACSVRLFVGVLRGNTIRGNTTRNSERKMAL